MNNINNHSNKVFSSFMWKVLERLFSQVFSLIIQIVLVRLVSPEHFGLLAIVMSFINYAAVFVQTGISTAIVQRKNLDNTTISSLLLVSLSIASFFYLLLFFTAPYLSSLYKSNDLCIILRILSIGLFLSAINSIQTGLLQRNMDFKALFYRSMIAVPISGFIGIVMALNDFGIYALVGHNLMNSLLMVLVMAYNNHLKLSFNFCYKNVLEIYNFSSKIMLGSLVSGASDFIRTLSIGKFYKKTDLAYYDKANTYSFYAVQIIGNALTSVLLPVLSKTQDNLIELKNIARKSIQLTSFFMFPFLITIAASSDNLVRVLFTNKWSECVPFFVVFCVLRIPCCIINLDKQVYYALGKSNITFYYEILLLILNLITISVTLKEGVYFIAIGALFVEFIGFIIIALISQKVYNYTIFERFDDLKKIILNSIVSGFICFKVQNLTFNIYLDLMFQLSISLITYIFLSILSKDRNIYIIIKLIKRRFEND